MLLYGISFEMLPGPVLIWLGWDIYHRVNKEPPLPGEPAKDNGEAAEAGAGAARKAEVESGAGSGTGLRLRRFAGCRMTQHTPHAGADQRSMYLQIVI